MEKSNKENLNDPVFLKKLVQRESEAVSTVVRQYTTPLLRAALGLGFDEVRSQELVQNVWTTFFDVVANFQGKSHIRTFVFGILYNKASEMHREDQKARQRDPIEEVMEKRFSEEGHWIRPPVDPERFHQSTQMLELIQRCIELLPLNQKMAFSLKEVDDRSSNEICNILEVSTTHLGVLLYRARNQLRECIESKA